MFPYSTYFYFNARKGKVYILLETLLNYEI